MNPNENTSELTDDLLEEAAMWHVRVSTDKALSDDWIAFTQWLEEDNRHVEAYNMIENVLIDTQALSASDFEDTDVLTDTSILSTGSTVLPGFLSRTVGLIKDDILLLSALFGLMLTTLAFFSFFNSNSESQLTPVHYVAGSESKSLIKLADGSAVDLNINSEIEVTLSETERRVAMIRGEAVFNVVGDPNRPFIINVDGAEVKVVGTVFNILSFNDALSVTVLEGVVEVRPDTSRDNGKDARDFQLKTIVAGEQLSFESGNRQPILRTVQPANILAWRDGQLIYENAKLSDVVEDLGRYIGKVIEVESSAQSLLFSGILLTDNLEASLLVLDDSLPISISRSDNIIHIASQ